MVDVRRVPEADFAAVYDLLCERVGDRDRETVRSWFDATPELFQGAYDDGDGLVGFALGRERSETSAELAGIGVERAYTRRGIGSRLLAAFEDAAADAGYGRVSLGSAGGYVDEFYLANGYEPESILVRKSRDESLDEYREADFAVLRERVHAGVRKLYVAPGGYDPERVDAVRDAFDDPDALYVMEKYL
ncbi:MAG: GNAT family N-acetyltransferase [Halobacterium sp.]